MQPYTNVALLSGIPLSNTRLSSLTHTPLAPCELCFARSAHVIMHPIAPGTANMPSCSHIPQGPSEQHCSVPWQPAAITAIIAIIAIIASIALSKSLKPWLVHLALPQPPRPLSAAKISFTRGIHYIGESPSCSKIKCFSESLRRTCICWGSRTSLISTRSTWTPHGSVASSRLSKII